MHREMAFAEVTTAGGFVNTMQGALWFGENFFSTLSFVLGMSGFMLRQPLHRRERR